MPVSIVYIYGEKMTNPLSQYFRQPAIYIKLPSQGNFYPEGMLDMPPNGELPVLPMTAIDEITYRTPDALFNGSAVANVIQSCMPNIKNGWAVPSVDLDAILVGIRIATYGHDLEINCFCPKCENQDQYTVDLRTSIDSMKPADYQRPLIHRDLEIYFQPMNYKMLNQNNQLQFEEQRALQAIAAVGEDDAKKQSTAISTMLQNITNMTIKSLAQSISAIKTPNSIVTDSKQIEEFLKNTDRKLFGQIRDQIIDLKSHSELKPMAVECTKCNNQYEQSFTLEMSNFFDSAS
jgi:hypothetical protein